MIAGGEPAGISWRSHDHDRVVHADIIHVAIADLFVSYGAHAADNNAFVYFSQC